ncbi:MAG: response regulator transcription factor [Lachnospiraceae bacterium]|nr:response regulator transcription factor [Lachnospiraceae bacterium]
MASILIVDDEAEIREMLKQMFTLENYMVYTAKDGQEALDKVSALMGKASVAEDIQAFDENAGLDIILLDINMPEFDGYEVCERIREYVNCPILFLTARIDEEDKVRGFRAGGDDYIEKPFSMVELKERVAAHLRRQERINESEKVGFRGAFTISYSGKQVLFEKEVIHLTKTEYEIVEFLSQHKNQVFTKEMIYEYLWGFDKDGESSIITEHIRRIRQKLKQYSDETMIETVWGVGYKWIG